MKVSSTYRCETGLTFAQVEGTIGRVISISDFYAKVLGLESLCKKHQNKIVSEGSLKYVTRFRATALPVGNKRMFISLQGVSQRIIRYHSACAVKCSLMSIIFNLYTDTKHVEATCICSGYHPECSCWALGTYWSH